MATIVRLLLFWSTDRAIQVPASYDPFAKESYQMEASRWICFLSQAFRGQDWR